MKKIFTAAAMMLCGALVTPASPVAAAEPPVRVIHGHGLEACPERSLCLYEGAHYNEGRDLRIWVVTGRVDQLADYGGNDETSSMYMNTPQRWWANIFEHDGSRLNSGAMIRMYGGKQVPSLLEPVWVYDAPPSNGGSYRTFNDVITSVIWLPE